MPRAKMHTLTDAKIRGIKADGKDRALIDGGGLYLLVRGYGAKEWVFRFTSPVVGKRRKDTLGAYPDISLQQARLLAAKRRAMVAKGLDPMLEDERIQKTQQQSLKATRARERNTVETIFKEWKKSVLQNRKDKGSEIERAFEKDVFPVIGKIPVGEVSRQDVKDILDRLLSRGVKRMANRMLSDLKQFFGFAYDEEYTINDPTRRMSKTRVGGIEKPRERFLNEQEREGLARALPSSGLHESYQRAIWLILATCCRVDEISRMRWADVDLKKRTLTIPAAHAKNGREHVIYLSDFAIAQLEALKKKKSSDWIFPNRAGSAPIHRQTLTKMVADRQRKKPIKKRTSASDSLKIGKERWRPHDLRRTGATIMQELGIFPHIIMKCLNQTPEHSMIETYQRAYLVEKQQEAFTLLGGYLTELQKTA